MADDKLRDAILQTLAYSEIFEYPLSLPEIHRYLTKHKASQEEVASALQQMTNLARNNGHYSLPTKDAHFYTRKERNEASRMLWQKSQPWNWLVAHIPFVRMAAVTGTLAVDNVETGADVDYLIVTEPGRLWTTRAMILGLDKVARQFGVTLCPNYLVTTDKLLFDDHNLFTARELSQMVPLSGLKIYKQMRRENEWASEWLPNAEGPPRTQRKALHVQDWLKALLELLFKNSLGTKLEKWEMQRKISKLGKQPSDSMESRFSADYCKGHFDGHGERTQTAFQRSLETLGERAE